MLAGSSTTLKTIWKTVQTPEKFASQSPFLATIQQNGEQHLGGATIFDILRMEIPSNNSDELEDRPTMTVGVVFKSL